MKWEELEHTNWIREAGDHEGIEVLCFDNFSGKDEIDECWTVFIPEEDLSILWEEMDSGYRRRGLAGVTQDCLANYDSEHFDENSVGFADFLCEIHNGGWIEETYWIDLNYRKR